MSELLCLGEPLIELNHHPDDTVVRGFGGDVSNCAIAAARLGASTGMICGLGADKGGDELFDLWQRENVETGGVVRHSSAPTGIYHIHHDTEGHHFSYERAGSAASLMTDSDLDHNAIADTKILHVSGISQAISDTASHTVLAAIDIARSKSTLVSYDTNLRLGLWQLEKASEVIHQAVALSDIVLPGLDDAAHLTGHDDPNAIVDFYLDLGPQIVALTMGGQGVLVATPEERKVVSAHTVEAVDATGAGDTFDGAFLAELLLGRNPFEAATFANAAAALSTQRYGAIDAMPTRDQVNHFLAS